MKTKKIIFLSALLLLSLTLMACSIPVLNIVKGSGTVVTESRQVSDFQAIVLDGTGKLVITQGDSTVLEIEAEDNILPYLKATVENNTLKLGYQDHFWQRNLLPTETIVYSLIVTDLNSITFNGAGDLEMNQLDTDSLTIIINGAGQVNVNDLTAGTLDIQINGTGSVDVNGEVTAQDITISGAGTVQNGDLKSSQTTIVTNGLGTATVWATDTLDITFNGSGTLNYYGEPAIIQNINGAADINHLGDK